MKILILIFIFVITAIGVFLGFRVLGLLKITKQLRTDRNELIKERSKQADQLRQKGIDIDELKKELAKYSDTEIKVALTSREKRMILEALGMPHYQSLVQNPKTEYFKREIYRGLKQKIKESIKNNKKIKGRRRF